MPHSNDGVAYPLWLRIRELCGELGLSTTTLLQSAGVRPATFGDWRHTRRAPQPRLINAVVEALNQKAQEAGREIRLDPEEARRLAGFVPTSAPGTTADVRQAIMENERFTDAQRLALLQIVESFEAQNGQAAADAAT